MFYENVFVSKFWNEKLSHSSKDNIGNYFTTKKNIKIQNISLQNLTSQN